MATSRLLLFALGLGGMLACGGGGGGSADAKSASIPSMPAYPDPKAQKADPAPEPPKSKDPKQICAGAPDLKVSLSSSSSSPAAIAERFLEARSERPERPVRSERSAKGTHSMADLQALEKRAAWEELLQHAEDIGPAQRGAAWDKLVERGAIGYMQQLTTNTAAFEGVFTSQHLLKRYPHLLKSQDFMTKRGEAGKAASEICLREAYRGQHCLEMMTDFLKTSNTGADVGFAFGKITRKNQNHYVAVPFFKWALDQKGDGKTNTSQMCGDEDLKLATIAGLGLPPDYDNAVLARQIAANACWDGLKAEIKKELIEGGATGYYRDNACAVMKAKGDL